MKPSVATRLRAPTEPPSGAAAAETIVCGNCGQRFAIRNGTDFQNAELIKKQASWVADQLVWDHIQERKHHGTMKLPNL